MDTRLNSVTFLTLTLLLTSLFASLCSVSEARKLHLHSPLLAKDSTVKEVNGIFRELKSSRPSTDGSYRLKNLQNLWGMKNSGPNPCCGHKLQNLGNMKDSGPSPRGPGHRLKTLQDLGVIKQSGPSPGEGHK